MVKFLASPEFFNLLMNFAGLLLLTVLTLACSFVMYVTVKEILNDD